MDWGMRCSFKLKVLLGIFVKRLLGFRVLNHSTRIYRPCLGPAMLTPIKAPNQARPAYRSARIALDGEGDYWLLAIAERDYCPAGMET
jgi:hypothetical protein